MLITRGWIRYTLLIPIVILILISFLAVQKAEGISSIYYEAPIYKIPISENTQRDIWKLCEENHLSYELVLAIYQIDGINNTQIDNIKAEIGKLAYIRDYWTEQGYPDEIVFDLLLLSHQRGIEGCINFMKDSDAYDLDHYVQKVTEYKYSLEQSHDAPPVIKKMAES
ncbi:MAG: hypothetical protein ACYCVD_00025 [Desulfitobacteriaceae bacterium]